MAFWQALYEAPNVLAPAWGHERIYAPQSYPLIRQALTVPLALAEAAVVARYYPLCWQRLDGELRLVALLALRPGQFRLAPYGDLPLILRAYPFIIPEEANLPPKEVVIDRAMADTPTDVGAPILMADHRFSPAARLRAGFALELASAARATRELTEDLETHGLLEPWPLKFDLGPAGAFERQDLSVFSAQQLANPALYSILERHGAQAGLFLGFHRTSLFRINWLIGLARQSAPGNRTGT